MHTIYQVKYANKIGFGFGGQHNVPKVYLNGYFKYSNIPVTEQVKNRIKYPSKCSIRAIY